MVNKQVNQESGLIYPLLLTGDGMEEGMGCTLVCAVGRSAADGRSVVGQTADLNSTHPYTAMNTSLNQETGIKTIGDAVTKDLVGEVYDPPLTYGWLNNRGVSYQMQALYSRNPVSGVAFTYTDSREAWTVEVFGYKGKTADVTAILETATTAKEAVDLMVALLEGQELEDGTNYGITGPLRDRSYARGNLVRDPRLRLAQEKIPRGIIRQKRAEELLAARDWFNDAIPYAASQLEVGYFFSITRDHINSWEVQRSYASNDTGDLSRWAYSGSTCWANVTEIDSESPDLLSIYWRTPNVPAFGPFIPFFIGLTEIPPAFAPGPQNQSGLFQELLNALNYNLDWADETQRFWESFDTETLRQVYDRPGVVTTCRQLVTADKRDDAQALLNAFVRQRLERAVTYARAIIARLNEEGLVKVNSDVFDVNTLLPGEDKK